jgi:phage terminase small subunit
MHGGQSLCGKKHPNYKHGSYCKDRPPSSQERVVGPSLDEMLARIVVEDAIDPSQQNSLRQAFEEAGQTFTPKQKRFVAEYFKDLNATRAYIRAGYAPKAARVEGHRLLKNPKISSVLQRVMKLRSRRTEHVQDRVVEGLAEIAFQKITDYVTWDDQGVVLKEFSPRRLGAISSTETKGPHSRIVRVRLHDKMKALKLLGRHLGLF